MLLLLLLLLLCTPPQTRVSPNVLAPSSLWCDFYGFNVETKRNETHEFLRRSVKHVRGRRDAARSVRTNSRTLVGVVAFVLLLRKLDLLPILYKYNNTFASTRIASCVCASDRRSSVCTTICFVSLHNFLYCYVHYTTLLKPSIVLQQLLREHCTTIVMLLLGKGFRNSMVFSMRIV
jgi:hypothetical protein